MLNLLNIVSTHHLREVGELLRRASIPNAWYQYDTNILTGYLVLVLILATKSVSVRNKKGKPISVTVCGDNAVLGFVCKNQQTHSVKSHIPSMKNLYGLTAFLTHPYLHFFSHKCYSCMDFEWQIHWVHHLHHHRHFLCACLVHLSNWVMLSWQNNTNNISNYYNIS